jgi:pantoate--beta-alanine ligase
MQIFRHKKDIRIYLDSLIAENKTIGLVPTMGALHKGHLALVQKAVSENDVVIVSIFVNPTQFNNQEDLNKYPNTLDADIRQLERISNDLIVFAPKVSEMYNTSITSKYYDFDGLDSVMEGEFREGHFNGVGTIVEELLTQIRPHNAYFGEKDFQQLQIIRKLVTLKQISVNIIGCPIIREANGLAMSSRNEQLSQSIRKEAGFIYKTLQAAKTKFGTKSASKVVEFVQNEFKKQKDLKLEYFQITEVTTLRSIRRKQKNKKYRAFVAVYADGVRLIDNIALN